MCERRGLGGGGIERAKYRAVLAVRHSTHRRHFRISAQGAVLCAGSGEETGHPSRSLSLSRPGIRYQRLLGELSRLPIAQVIAATATLYTCVQLHAERVGHMRHF